MVKNLPVWVFMAIALIAIGFAEYPLLRVALGLDESISIPFSTAVMFMIGGLMSGLTAMILLVRRAPQLESDIENSRPVASLEKARFHACGLLIFTLVPLLNFLVAYWIWINTRHQSSSLDDLGREILNFQISIYLYLLLSLFMVFAVIGILTTPMILVFHFLITVLAITFTSAEKKFTYPLNITII